MKRPILDVERIKSEIAEIETRIDKERKRIFILDCIIAGSVFAFVAFVVVVACIS